MKNATIEISKYFEIRKLDALSTMPWVLISNKLLFYYIIIKIKICNIAANITGGNI